VDYPEDRGSQVPRIVTYAPIYKKQHPKGSEALTAPLSECQISKQKSHMASGMTRNNQYTGVWKDVVMLYSKVPSQHLTREVNQLRP
jgi:hypothetical protein